MNGVSALMKQRRNTDYLIGIPYIWITSAGGKTRKPLM